MVWNYRVVKSKVQDEIFYGIHETYYGMGDEDIPRGSSTEFLDGLGVSFQEHPATAVVSDIDDEDPRVVLRGALLRMLAACDKPVIDGTAEGEEVEVSTGTYQLDSSFVEMQEKIETGGMGSERE